GIESFFPNHISIPRVEAAETTPGAEREDSARTHDGGWPRPKRILGIKGPFGVVGFVGVSPEVAPRFRIEAEDAFAGWLAGDLGVDNINAAAGDDRAGKSRPDRYAPCNLQPRRRE